MKKIFYIAILSLCAINVFAQTRTVQNRPYTDLRKFHFGVMVGAHMQDLELLNAGPQMVDLDDGNGLVQKTVSADQDRWDAGFTVGVLGELRINTTFQFRVAPAMYFGTRHITFRNLTDLDANGEPTEQVQDLKSAYISCALDLIAAAPRFNNHRPYVMVGINPMLNLSGKDDDYLKLKGGDAYLEAGIGCDFYASLLQTQTRTQVYVRNWELSEHQSCQGPQRQEYADVHQLCQRGPFQDDCTDFLL